MGQALSVNQESFKTPTFTAQEVQLPLSLGGAVDTTVLNVGHLPARDQVLYHIVGGKKQYPYPVNYRATCTLYSRPATLSTALDPATNTIRFIINTHSDGAVYSASTPTGALAKLALAMQRIDLPNNGLEVFGFLDARIQYLLRQMDTTNELDQPIYQIQQPTSPPASPYTSPTPKTPLVASPAQQQQQQPAPIVQPAASLADTTRVPSVAASLKHWLELNISTNGGNPLPLPATVAANIEQQQRLVLEAPPAPGLSMSPVTLIGTPLVVGSSRLPPLPNSSTAAVSPFQAATTTPQQQQQQQPLSRTTSLKRKGSQGSEGRGWTSFTAFGLEQRDIVRSQYPGISPVEVEKLVGQRWAKLSGDEKQRYADQAAQVRRVSQQMEGSGDLKRMLSDAATLGPSDERRQRTRRRPQFFGEFETSLDQIETAATFQGQKASLEQVVHYPIEQRQLQQLPPLSSVTKEKKKKKKQTGGGKKRPKSKQAVEAHERAEAEEDVLDLLTEMRAMASDEDGHSDTHDDQQQLDGQSGPTS